MSLTSRIQALTAYANEVTGESDTTLADAVATLAQGYGQGGIASGTFTGDNTSVITLNTGLSTVHGFAIYRTDDNSPAVSVSTSILIYDYNININLLSRSNNAGTVAFSGGGFNYVTATVSNGIISVTAGAKFGENMNYKWVAW